MKLYALTEAGKVAAKRDGDDDEMRVLHFIRDHKTATDSELEVIADSYIVRRLVRGGSRGGGGLVKELTT